MAGQAEEDSNRALVTWVAVKIPLRVGAGAMLGQCFQEMLLARVPPDSEMEFKHPLKAEPQQDLPPLTMKEDSSAEPRAKEVKEGEGGPSG